MYFDIRSNCTLPVYCFIGSVLFHHSINLLIYSIFFCSSCIQNFIGNVVCNSQALIKSNDVVVLRLMSRYLHDVDILAFIVSFVTHLRDAMNVNSWISHNSATTTDIPPHKWHNFCCGFLRMFHVQCKLSYHGAHEEPISSLATQMFYFWRNFCATPLFKSEGNTENPIEMIPNHSNIWYCDALDLILLE